MKKTAKYLAACELTRVRGDNARVYAAVGRAGFAWDSAAGWYVVDERATGRVKLRLEGTFKDVVAFAAKLGVDLEPTPGRKGGWLAYGSTKSGASPVRRAKAKAKRSPRRPEVTVKATPRVQPTAKRSPRRPEVTEVKPRRAKAKRSPRRPEVTEVKPRRAKATPRPRADVMADAVAGLLDEALAAPPARGRRPVAPIGFTAFAGNRIRQEMRAAADNENFELAADLRDRAKLKPGRRRRSS